MPTASSDETTGNDRGGTTIPARDELGIDSGDETGYVYEYKLFPSYLK